MFLLRALALLPLPLLYALSSVASACLYHIVRYRRAVVRDNLHCAFPQFDERRRRVVEQGFYRQLTDVAVEIIATQRMSLDHFRERVQLENPELLHTLSQDSRRSLIVLTIHQGNWEWMLHGTTAALGMRMDPVYKPLHNKHADRLMHAVRSRFGARPLPLKSAARQIVKERDSFRLLALVADQSPTRREKGLWVDFMHRPAAFHTGAESLARSTGFPVVFARCRRLRRGHYSLRFIPIAAPPFDEPEGAITRRYAELAQRAIVAEPESWLWSNRRWKRRPEHDETVG